MASAAGADSGGVEGLGAGDGSLLAHGKPLSQPLSKVQRSEVEGRQNDMVSL
jgi:hypothetical protein